MPVDPNSHVPIYEQIVEHIRGSVAAGVYRPGEMLPSIRALAVSLVVTPNTVQRAYLELEREGLAYTRKGLGVFVTENGDRSARDRSEAAVRDRFCQGIELGRAAKMRKARIEAIFRGAMGEADGASGDDATAPSQGPISESRDSS